MKNPFRSLHEIQRDLGDVAVTITQTHLVQFSGAPNWQPAINAFRCGSRFIICVELAGVERSAIDVRAEPRRLIIRGTRPMPEPACDEEPAAQLLALEIDHGQFQRVLELPLEVEHERVSAEFRNGLLWIKLPLRAHG